MPSDCDCLIFRAPKRGKRSKKPGGKADLRAKHEERYVTNAVKIVKLMVGGFVRLVRRST